MAQIIHKSALPSIGNATFKGWMPAEFVAKASLKEPHPIGFPLLFSRDLRLIEPAVAYLHEHLIHQAHSQDTVRTYSEILNDWFNFLETNEIQWHDAEAIDLIHYRNRMLHKNAIRTGKALTRNTINHRVRGVLRFYKWAAQRRLIENSQLAKQINLDHKTLRPHARFPRAETTSEMLILRQYEQLPSPLSSTQTRELLATLPPPYDLIARWQTYTGLRLSEVLSLKASQIRTDDSVPHYRISVLRKGPKHGYVIAPRTLMNETLSYIATYRKAWISKVRERGNESLFIGPRGNAVSKRTYQRQVKETGQKLGIRANTHLLRATFACLLLSRLENLSKQGEPINPLLIVKILMGHSHIETTDKYLRAIALEKFDIEEILQNLLNPIIQ